jgi:CBS domain containing-hemolysin-like protein
LDVWLLVGSVVLLAALTFFATLNLALRIPSRARLAEQFRQKGRTEALSVFVAELSKYAMATAVLRAAASLGMFLIMLTMTGAWTGTRPELARVIAFAIALVLVVAFGIAIPNAWAKYSGEWLIVRVLHWLPWMYVLCAPLIVVMDLFDPLVRRLCGVPVRDATAYAQDLQEEILTAVSEMERHGAVDEEQKEMIESVIELRNTLVEEIMTPRTEIVAIPRDATLPEIKELIRSKGHSRIPVYDETIDRSLGVLYAKDLLHIDETQPFDLTRLTRKVTYIPETKRVRDLLHEFQEQQVHIAIVLDEYGGTAGLVTIEDILEELVGDIADEYETAPPAPIKRIDEHTVEVDARMRIEDLNDELQTDLPEDEDYETVGGFIFSTLGRVPKVGETCEHGRVGLRVVDAEPRRIRRIRIHTAPVPAEGNPGG